LVLTAGMTPDCRGRIMLVFKEPERMIGRGECFDTSGTAA
jgi:hypothetical protein